MVKVVDYEEFEALCKRFSNLESENRFLKSLLLGQRWLSRKETMNVIGCKGDKLRQLTTHKRLTYRIEGKSTFYCVFSVRNYLADQKIDEREADKRILSVRFGADLTRIDDPLSLSYPNAKHP